MITPYKNRTIDLSIPVKVYRNLNKKGVVYSIKQKGLVKAHGNNFVLKNCKLTASCTGSMLVKITKVRNVHAYIVGYLSPDITPRKSHHIIRYNPYKNDTFIDSEGKELYEADMISFTNEGVFNNQTH